ncbi:hypothetical protein BC830DRAFT_1135044 [Chytriomyces sp. MP71]|nr:hypothetical protein BC830DRAFT_1135044 [Chytriomyces sp. MP71]
MEGLNAECMVCLGELAAPTNLKSGYHTCNTCFKVFHFDCIQSWAYASARSSPRMGDAETATDGAFRCPACQCPQGTASLGTDGARCFCGKHVFDATAFRGGNSCGETCGKVPQFLLAVSDANLSVVCKHPCSEVCHSGPCPKCTRYADRTCHCGQTRYQVSCGFFEERRACASKCGKRLNCALHFCARKCHSGPCANCEETVEASCFCGANQKSVVCGSEVIMVAKEGGAKTQKFGCNQGCGKALACGKHICTQLCHIGDCEPCERMPELVSTCPCGAITLSNLGITRKSCLDPIPTCCSTCDKKLPCAHYCLEKCHSPLDPCRCVGQKTVSCDCGKSSDQVPCSDYIQNEKKGSGTHIKCNSLCKTLRNCGKHQCSNRCCILKGDSSLHDCPLPCNKMLQCGNHRCAAGCHSGHCRRCLVATFDEVSCNCGDMRLIPPIPCGTTLSVTCAKKCARPPGSCGHPRDHNCHSGVCPPCQHLVNLRCHSGHQTRSFPCNQVLDDMGAQIMNSFSCPVACGTQLSKCHHKCLQPCHTHDARNHEREPCAQTCAHLVPSCTRDHRCRSNCGHEGPCTATGTPDASPCAATLTVTCMCGALSGMAMSCSALDAAGLVVVSAGVGSRRNEVRVDCTTALHRGCVERRRARFVRASFAGNVVARIKEMPSIGAGRVVNAVSTLASQLATEAVKSGGAGCTGLWFVDIPLDVGRREVAEFVRGCCGYRFEFLNVTPAIGLPEFPKTVMQDMRMRRTAGAESGRDHVVWLIRKSLTDAEVSRFVGGREGWVVPLFIESKLEKSAATNSSIHRENTAEVADVAEATEPDLQYVPNNTFEVLENVEPVMEPVSIEIVNAENEAAKKSKKKKAKSKAVEAEVAIVAKTLEKIEDPTVQAKPSNLCAHSGCKEKLGVMGQYCKYCDRKYCMAHRYPAVHSERCAAQEKSLSQNAFKKDALLGIAIGKNQTQGGKSGSLAKEREDAKKRLAEKIRNARK